MRHLPAALGEPSAADTRRTTRRTGSFPRATQTRDRTASRATSTSIPGGEASADGSPCRWDSRPLRPPRHEERFHRLDGACELVTLDGAGRIDMLRTDLRALADERAPPDALVLRQHFHALRSALIPVVEVVPLSKGDGGGADEFRIEPVHRTRRIAQHAVDAHTELLVFVKLLRRLQVLAFSQRFLVLANDVRFHAHEFAHEIADVDDEIADDREVAKRLDANRSGRVLGQERRARQLRLAIDRHPAAAADPHPAGPAE